MSDSKRHDRDDTRDDEPKSHPDPDLRQPKTDQERIRTEDSGLSQPEEAAVEENMRRGVPKSHRN